MITLGVKDLNKSIKFYGKGFNGFTISHNVSSKDEVDMVFTDAISVGAKIIKSPQKASWGGYSSYFADPDNYFWEVAYNPHSWIGPTD